MSELKILITGATGYVGGTVITELLSSSSPSVRNASISVLIRKPEQADLFASLAAPRELQPVLLTGGLADTSGLRHLAATGGFDIIINAADTTNPTAAEALIQGLADVSGDSSTLENNKKKHFIHLSGVSSLADKPITTDVTPVELSDKHDDVLAYMQGREDAGEFYSQRDVDLRVVAAGESREIPVYQVKAPRIFGRGTGPGNTRSVHIPMLIAGAVKAGSAEFVGEGAGKWDDVHVVDVAKFFELLVRKIVDHEPVGSGKKGLYFVELVRHSWKELAEMIAGVGVELGALKSLESGKAPTASLNLAEMAAKYIGDAEYFIEVAKSMGGLESMTEVGFASNAMTKADLARDLGWTASYGEAEFRQSIVDDFKEALRK